MPNIEEILQGARDAMTAGRVYGEPVEHEGVTVIPAATVGGGGGGGGDESNNGGVGYGLGARPVGAFVIRGDQVTWVPAVDVSRVLLFALAALVLLRPLLRR